MSWCVYRQESRRRYEAKVAVRRQLQLPCMPKFATHASALGEAKASFATMYIAAFQRRLPCAAAGSSPEHAGYRWCNITATHMSSASAWTICREAYIPRHFQHDLGPKAEKLSRSGTVATRRTGSLYCESKLLLLFIQSHSAPALLTIASSFPYSWQVGDRASV